MNPFRNEPVLELRRAPVRAELAQAVEGLDARLPLRVPVWIGDERRDGEELVSTDPGRPERTVATAARGNCDDALRAPRVGRHDLVAFAPLPPDPDRHAQRQAQLTQADRELRALRRAAQLEHGLVAKRGQRGAHDGAARSCSSGTPCAWSARKLSLAVFSSRRRTR